MLLCFFQTKSSYGLLKITNNQNLRLKLGNNEFDSMVKEYNVQINYKRIASIF